MYKYHLSLGSNIAPRSTHLKQAVDQLAEIGEIAAKSGIFETSPWGFTDQPNFLNANIRLYSACAPPELLVRIKAIEERMGREAGPRWGPRIIDIDIIWCDQIRLNEQDLALPHPHFQDRRFVLEPLREITETLQMSDGLTSVSDLLANCNDKSVVHKTEIIW
jgi:2-amino-4-hydroxy-6-hydroxymethyldihydropteridine diphosphokinase